MKFVKLFRAVILWNKYETAVNDILIFSNLNLKSVVGTTIVGILQGMARLAVYSRL